MDDFDCAPEHIIATNAAAYAQIVDAWDNAWNAENEAKHEPCRRIFIEHLNGPSVLDAGCGIGRDSIFFAGQGLRVTAADIVTGFLALIRKKNPTIAVAAMDITRSCFGDASFDGIYCFASFLHVPRALSFETLVRLRAVLKPGGILLLQHVASRKGHETYRVDDLLIKDNPAYCSCHDEEELTDLVIRAGFTRSELYHAMRTEEPSPVALKYGLEPYQLLAWV